MVSSRLFIQCRNSETHWPEGYTVLYLLTNQFHIKMLSLHIFIFPPVHVLLFTVTFLKSEFLILDTAVTKTIQINWKLNTAAKSPFCMNKNECWSSNSKVPFGTLTLLYCDNIQQMKIHFAGLFWHFKINLCLCPQHLYCSAILWKDYNWVKITN